MASNDVDTAAKARNSEVLNNPCQQEINTENNKEQDRNFKIKENPNIKVYSDGEVEQMMGIQPGENMASISNEQVGRMFMTMMKEMQDIKKELISTRQRDDTAIKEVTNKQDDQQAAINRISGETAYCKTQVNKLTDVVTRQSHIIKELKNKVEDLEKNQIKDNIVIKGIEVSDNENCKELAQRFFKNNLKIENQIGIKGAFRIGKKNKYRPILVMLNHNTDKATIFSHSKNLKGQLN